MEITTVSFFEPSSPRECRSVGNVFTFLCKGFRQDLPFKKRNYNLKWGLLTLNMVLDVDVTVWDSRRKLGCVQSRHIICFWMNIIMCECMKIDQDLKFYNSHTNTMKKLVLTALYFSLSLWTFATLIILQGNLRR